MKKVFVIDDDADVRDVIVFALEEEGYEVEVSENGKQGLEMLRSFDESHYPGLIIVDYLMPEMDGITFIKTLKTEYADSLGKIPMVISSAMGQMDEFDFLSDVGRLYKPMDLEDLLKLVKKYCT
ncbi:response regulator [Peredibacter sp. HCB2-198]|uniref:response regulator n=1 Tax=Peredibacter sp. HCB2-198 TaxID=3383025 RepID=UPI0038B61083